MTLLLLFMPNDCTNSLTISDITTDQWKEIASTFQVRDPDLQQDFLKTFYPEPDYTTTPVALTYPQMSAQNLKPEEDRQTILKNEPSIRQNSWWDWRVQHWGTKWDVYSCFNNWSNETPSSEFSACFLTAWSPLSENCMKALSVRFPGATLVNYYEEVGEDFCGVMVAKDGMVCDHCEPMSEYREPFIRQQFPDIDSRLEAEGQDLDDFFWEHCDLGMLSDFIREELQIYLELMIQEIRVAFNECKPAAVERQ